MESPLRVPSPAIGTADPSMAGVAAGTAEMVGGSLPGASPGPSPELIVTNRTGSVLLRNTILKSDHFPGTHRSCQSQSSVIVRQNHNTVPDSDLP